MLARCTAAAAGAPTMIHVDLYRLLDHTGNQGADLLGELDSLDLDSDLDDAVVVAEWVRPGRASRAAAPGHPLERVSGSDVRIATWRWPAGAVMSPLVLALDTSTPAVTAGIVRRDDLSVLASGSPWTPGRTPNGSPECACCPARFGLNMTDLRPSWWAAAGPFTGLRAGMATAAAYGHALASRARRVQPAGIVRRDDLSVLAQRITVDARAHAERLTPNALAALHDSGLNMTDLAAVVVGCGPGPFTGLRAG
ncbi:tRNA threonylcarbamoyl adenosine modification protein YeaZ, partial [Mycobacterium avium MAV_120809_2495]